MGRFPALRGACAGSVLSVVLCLFTVHAAPGRSEPIPMERIGVVAAKQYQGDGLSIAATREGARLRCVFQKLDGQATREGLWLTSTADASKAERFRVVAVGVGCVTACAPTEVCEGKAIAARTECCAGAKCCKEIL